MSCLAIILKRGLIFVAVVLDEASQTVETKGSLLKGLLGNLLDDDDDVDDATYNLDCEEVVQSMRQLLGPISGAVGGQGPSASPEVTWETICNMDARTNTEKCVYICMECANMNKQPVGRHI